MSDLSLVSTADLMEELADRGSKAMLVVERIPSGETGVVADILVVCDEDGEDKLKGMLSLVDVGRRAVFKTFHSEPRKP